MKEIIASSKNPRIRSLLALRKNRNRKIQGKIIIEGEKEIGMALKAGITLHNLFVCDEYLTAQGESLVKTIPTKLLVKVSEKVFNQIVVRENSGGLVAIGSTAANSIQDLKPGTNSIYVILESVEKPGNLGAILRTADAAGVSGLIVCDPKTDLYNPNVIRSSLGCVFSVELATATLEETKAWLKKHKVKSFATFLDSSEPYFEQDFSGKIAIIMGTESMGLTNSWREIADSTITIPMKGKVDSMNVSVSAAIVLFEALRQRLGT